MRTDQILVWAASLLEVFLRPLILLVVMLYATSLAWSAPLEGVDSPLRQAYELKEFIATKEQDLARRQESMIDSLQKAVDRFESASEHGANEVFQEMQPLVRALSAASQDILKNEVEYLASLKRLLVSHYTTPEAYLAAAKLFKEYAAEEPYAEIKEDYLKLAETWSLLSERSWAEMAAIEAEEAELIAFKQYLERSSLFLKRLDAHLSSVPNQVDEQQRQLHLAKMKRYVKGFEELRASLHTFHEKVKTTSRSSAIEQSKLAAAVKSATAPDSSHASKSKVAVARTTNARTAKNLSENRRSAVNASDFSEDVAGIR
ncbi:MAG TPA: hypothetical protein VGN12_00950 [Pirellulales bacterium]|jgi:hypothetical protein